MQNNPYEGKWFSVIGDSISTLEGYVPDDYPVYYVGETALLNGVLTPEDTWWGRIISHLGGRLLCNNSWSGSMASQLPGFDFLFPSGCSDERTGALGTLENTPDVIMLYLGINDYFSALPLQSEVPGDLHAFEQAYPCIIEKLRKNYPNAEIWCITLCIASVKNDSEFIFALSVNDQGIDEFNDIIRNAAKTFDCRVADTFKYSIPYDSLDGLHPTKAGMETFSNLILKEIL